MALTAFQVRVLGVSGKSCGWQGPVTRSCVRQTTTVGHLQSSNAEQKACETSEQQHRHAPCLVLL